MQSAFMKPLAPCNYVRPADYLAVKVNNKVHIFPYPLPAIPLNSDPKHYLIDPERHH